MQKYDKEGTGTFEYDEGQSHIVIQYAYGIQFDYDQDIGTGRYQFCGLIDVSPISVLANGPMPDFDDQDLLEDLRFDVKMNHL